MLEEHRNMQFERKTVRNYYSRDLGTVKALPLLRSFAKVHEKVSELHSKVIALSPRVEELRAKTGEGLSYDEEKEFLKKTEELSKHQKKLDNLLEKYAHVIFTPHMPQPKEGGKATQFVYMPVEDLNEDMHTLIDKLAVRKGTVAGAAIMGAGAAAIGLSPLTRMGVEALIGLPLVEGVEDPAGVIEDPVVDERPTLPQDTGGGEPGTHGLPSSGGGEAGEQGLPSDSGGEAGTQGLPGDEPGEQIGETIAPQEEESVETETEPETKLVDDRSGWQKALNVVKAPTVAFLGQAIAGGVLIGAGASKFKGTLEIREGAINALAGYISEHGYSGTFSEEALQNTPELIKMAQKLHDKNPGGVMNLAFDVNRATGKVRGIFAVYENPLDLSR